MGGVLFCSNSVNKTSWNPLGYYEEEHIVFLSNKTHISGKKFIGKKYTKIFNKAIK